MAASGNLNTHDDESRRQLLEVLSTLRPYLPEIVVIGGWVPSLYKQYGGLNWAGQVSFTNEVDVLTQPDLPVREQTLEETLRDHQFAPGRDDDASAVWTQAGANGAEIEFLCPMIGPARSSGMTKALPGHGHVGTIQLEGLQLLLDFTQVLAIPVMAPGQVGHVDVRVPTLGAYVVNKAETFPQRRPYLRGDNPKRAKDVLYLRDVAAAGGGVLERVSSDVRSMTKKRLFNVRSARNNLLMTVNRSLAQESVANAAEILGQREGQEVDAASADILGNLQDLLEVVDRALPKRKRPRRS